MNNALKFATATLALLSATAQAAELELTVQNITSGQGAVMVAVFNEAGQWLKTPIAVAQQPASTQMDGKLTLVLKDLPDGALAPWTAMAWASRWSRLRSRTRPRRCCRRRSSRRRVSPCRPWPA